MADELELKAVVPDPADLRERLAAAGAEPQFSGLMSDRRFDRDGELLAKGQTLRVRTYHHPSGADVRLAWKGPVSRAPGGYKRREELEYQLIGGSRPERLLEALGYSPVHAIDRWVEYWTLDSAELRLETYPRMDRLLEVEGTPDAIETAIRATGLPRAAFSDEALDAFVKRYAQGGGRPVLSIAGLNGARPMWEPE